ncbi:MAG: metal ABC transporter substrate-binding protein [Deltaproteobacteria bacterium]|nr:metal ABC transporter substrate-binding protein [Deltaproteobacteria bacterium]
MKNLLKVLISMVISGLCAYALMSPGNGLSKSTEQLEIICTTTLIESVVKEIGQNKVSVTTIVPSGMCPGHFDISPGEIERIKKSDFFLAHGFERFVEGLIKSQKGKIQVIKIGIRENWMIPGVQIRAVNRITDIMCHQCSALESFFRNNARQYTQYILMVEREVLSRLGVLDPHDASVLCSLMNAGFVKWIGLNIIATFPRDEDISVKCLSQIIIKAKEESVRFVIDNLQSSGKVGKTLATELNVPLVMISNFPRGENKSISYIETLKENCGKIISALKDTSH